MWDGGFELQKLKSGKGSEKVNEKPWFPLLAVTTTTRVTDLRVFW
jgi:hypothetical protein